jgi:Tol biopolymer transport system component
MRRFRFLLVVLVLSAQALYYAQAGAPPVARSVVVTTQEGTAKSGTLVATDASGALTFSLATPPAKGTLVIDDATTGAFTYTPHAGALGYDSFTFVASDGSAASTATGAIFIVTGSPQWPGQTVRASVAPNGSEMTTPSTWGTAASADGRFIAFSSGTIDEATGEFEAHVYIHDRQTGQTTLASKATGSEQSIGGVLPSITPDGRYVSFTTLTSRVPGGDPNAGVDVFMHDRQTGQTTRVNVASDGTPGNGESGLPAMSADGRHVAFYSRSTNLAAGDSDDDGDVYLRDRVTGQTTLVSVSSTGAKGNSGSFTPTMSADGRYIAFWSEATNLVPGDTNGQIDLFVRDLWTGQTTRASVGSGGVQLDAHAGGMLSADGRFVVFNSAASNAVPGDTNGVSDVFVHDRQTGQTTRVSVSSTGAQGLGESSDATISADGRYVAFRSAASNLVPGDTNGLIDEFVHDRLTGQMVRVNVASDGTQANNFSTGDPDDGCCILPFISADGRSVVITSLASNLVAGDTNNTDDVFVVGPVLVSPTTTNVPAAGGARSVDVSFDYPGTPWTATTTTPWITLTPPSGGSANGTVSFTVAPNTGAARTGTIVAALQTITVNQGPPSVPIAQNSAISTPEDISVASTLIASDADGDAITFSVLTQPALGAVTITNPSTGAFVYSPTVNFNGTDIFTFRASDGTTFSNTGTVSVSITPVNDAPLADGVVLAATEDVSSIGTLVATDVDGDALTFSIVTPPSNGTVTINATTGAFLYMPAANFSGSDSFTFRATDASLSSNIATVAIEVAPAGPPAPASFHTIGDLSGGPLISAVRDATRISGVTYAVGASAANNQILCVAPNNPVGCVPQFTTDTPVLWTWNGSTATLTPLPSLVTPTPVAVNGVTASAITPDASYIASAARSNAANPAQALAVRVTRNGLINLNISAPPFPPLPQPASAQAISADGSILYTTAGSSPPRAGRVDVNASSNTMIPLLLPAHTGNAVAGRGTSFDGSVMVGTSFTAPFTGTNGRAFRYVHASPVGAVSAIPLLVGGTWNKSLAVSPDGRLTLVGGNSTFLPNGEVYVYDAVTGITTPLGSPNTPWTPGNLAGMTADGSVVVATFIDGANPDGHRHAYVHNAHGWFHLTTILAAAGIDLAAGGWQAEGMQVNGISPDGTLVFGFVERDDEDGTLDGFVAELPPGYLAEFNVTPTPPADTSIVGVWSGSDGDAVAILADGTYFHIDVRHGTQPAAEFTSGFERGTYHWDTNTGVITGETLQDTNGSVGLSGGNGLPGFTAVVTGNTLVLAGELILARVTGAPGSIAGGWVFGDPRIENSSGVLVLFADGKFIFAEDGNSALDPFGRDGVEAGTYSWGANGSFTATVTLDTNGEWGFGNGPGTGGTTTLQLSPDSLHLGEPGDPNQLTRVEDPQAVVPVITSPLVASGVVGSAFAYTITATHALTFGATGLPSGLSINAATGLISGTPTAVGSSTVTISASNSFNSAATASLTITIAAPTGLTVANASGSFGGTTTLTATLMSAGTPLAGQQVSFSLNGSPAGTATTNASGIASLGGVGLAGTGAGTYATGVQATFAGNATHAAALGAATLTVAKAIPVITWPAPAAITHGTPLSSVQLNATTNVPGTFAYAPPSGTVLPVGAGQTLSIMFTPTDGANFATVQAQVTITVLNAAPVARGVVVTTQEGVTKGGTLLAIDAESDPLTFSILTPPTKGTLTLVNPSTGAFTYAPNAGAIGYDSFTYRAAEAGGASSTATGSVFIVATSPRWPGQTVRASVASDGGEQNGASNLGAMPSADGRFIVFTSGATNLVAGIPAGSVNVFVHDRQTGQTSLVSKASGSEQPIGGVLPRLTPDGRYVGFATFGSSLPGGNPNAEADAVVHDRVTGQTTRVSVASDGTAGNGSSILPMLSADGRYVTFYGTATNLVAENTDGGEDVYLHDRQTGQTTLVSVNSAGQKGNNGSWAPSISADGRFIAFQSEATNLVPNDTNGAIDVFVRDLWTGQTTRASVTSSGGQANSSSQGAMSPDGRYVVFASAASNLVAGDTNSRGDVFVRDLQTGQTTRVSLSSTGAQGNGSSEDATVSADGRYVAFRSIASNLVAGDTNGEWDEFVHDRLTGQTVRINVASDGTQANAASLGDDDGCCITPAISADGRSIVITSLASNLVAGDTNGSDDVFVVGPVLVSPTTIDVSGSAGTHSVNVVADYPGPWTAATLTPWITLNPPVGGSGSGTLSFTVGANPGAARTGTIVVALQTVTVNQGPSTAPVAQNGSFATLEDTPFSGTLVATDPNGDALTFSIVTSPLRGNVVITDPATGAFMYTPALNAFGGASFTFQASAAGETSNIATVIIDVTPVNDAPSAFDSTLAATEDIPASSFFSTADGDSLFTTVELVTPPAHGTVTIPNPSGGALGGISYTYTPSPNYNGPDSFTFRAVEGALGSNVATVTISVVPANDAPVASSMVVTAPEGDVQPELLQATDIDGDTLTFTIVAPPTKGTLTITDAATGAFTFTPNAGASGYDTFAFRAADSSGASSSATAMVFIVASSPRWPGGLVRASVASNGAQANADSFSVTVSADGRYTAFESNASNLVAGDTNDMADVFVRDRNTGVTTRVSVGSGGVQANSISGSPTLSADGRYVAFISSASNLVTGDSNGQDDVFVRDLQSGQTTRVGPIADPTATFAILVTPAISADGRYVAFVSVASNLVAGDTNGLYDVFVHDRQTGQTTRVSVASNGTPANQSSFAVKLSADGRYVAFTATASNLVSGDTNGQDDVFVHDRQTGQTTRASVSTAGTQANGFNREPEISADGRYVAFYSSASNLVAGDTNAVSDVFVRDLSAGQTTRMSVASDGAQANQSSFVLALSADARYVLFDSSASNLVPGDTNARSDLFVRDRQTGVTTRVSLTDDGSQPGFGANGTVMSADGRFIGFYSFAANLLPSDTNGTTDVFVFGGVSVSPTAVSVPSSGGSRNVNVAFVYPGTPWTASTTTPWITINPPAGGSANGAVILAVAPNAGAARTGTLVVASQTVTVSQDAATAPVAQSSSVTETHEDTSVTGTLVATDPNGDPITFSLVDLPTHGTVVLNDAATGAFTYTPAPNFHGMDGFTFRAAAGGELSNVAVIAIPVTPINDVPVAAGGSLAAAEDSSATGTLTAVDVDGDALTFTVLTPPAHGIVTITNTMTGAYTYWPAANYNGADSFTFRAFDGGTLSNIATVSVSVAVVEDAPLASSVVLATPESVAVSGTLLATDADGDAVTLTVLTSPTRGSLTVTDPTTSAFTYTPNPGAVGYDSFTFSASNAAGSSTGTASIVIVANSPRWPGQTVRVGTLPGGNSQFATISADGRYIAFGSSSSTLVAGDTNGQPDVFVYDRQTSVTARISVASDGTQGNGFSVDPSLSADGRYVAFRSTASNLVAGDTNEMTDMFVHDRQTGVTTRVSVASDGTQSNGLSQEAAISTDGRYVTFKSSASNLVPADTNDVNDVFVHDRHTGMTTRESVANNGLQGFKSSEEPALSGDGRYVAFYSAEGFVAADTNAVSDVFVRDRQTGATTRVSVATGGEQGNSNSSVPSLSVDGRYVAFGSDASNLVAGDTNGVSDVFVHDRQTGVTSRVSVTDDGTQGNGISGAPMLSADGRFVAFMSFASNLVAGDTNGQPDVFVHDRQTSLTKRVSVASNGTQGSGLSFPAAFSADGRHLAFSSAASNLVTGDTNGVEDIFVVGGAKVSPTAISVPADGGASSFDVSFDYPGTTWGVATTTPWIAVLPPASGSTNRTVTFDVAPNFGPARTGTIVAALQTITVTQDGFADVTPPTVTPPAAIAVYATVPGGATAGTLPALADFLAGATAVDDAPAAPVGQPPQLNGAAITDTTVLAPGLNSVTFIFTDTAGNVGTATSVVAVIGGGRPSLVVSLVGTIPAAGNQNVTMRVTNNGTGNALGVNIALSSVRTLAGTGNVTLVSGLPAGVPLVSPGQSLDVSIVLNVPSTVRRFAISETVTMTDHMGASLTTTASQTVFPTDVTRPTIVSGPTTTVTSTTMTIAWQTNEPATSRVDYGVGTTVNRTVPEDSVYKTTHTVTLTGLLPNTNYSYIVSGRDPSGNHYVSIRLVRRTNP